MRLPLLLAVALLTLYSGGSIAQPLEEEPTQEGVILCSFSLESEQEPTQSDRREELRDYLSELDQQMAFQIEDLESLVPSERVHALRDDHYDWKEVGGH